MRVVQALTEPSQQGRVALRLSERRVVVAATDLLALNAALCLALSRRFTSPDGLRWLGDRPEWFLLLSGLWLLVARGLDGYEARTLSRLPDSLLASTKAVLLTGLVYLLIPYITPPLPASRGGLLLFPALGCGLVGAGRLIVGLVLPRMEPLRAVIVGAGWAGRTIAEVLSTDGQAAYRVVGFVDDDPAKQVRPLEIRQGCALRVLGDRRVLPDLVCRHRITTVVLAITREVDAELLAILLDCLERGAEVVPMPVLYEQLTGRVPVEHVGENWYVALPLSHPGTSQLWQFVKRGMDVVLGGAGLAVLLGLLPWIALAIYLDNPGPIFYVQERVGKGGRIFRLYKFRTMVPDAERSGPQWARRNDPRVTRVGRFLRATHLDELPQVWNVLLGEMSAVGPRPERPEFVEELARTIPFYQLRHAVKPGMAGWALVKQGYAAGREDALVRLQYDLYYIKHQSLWLDLVILLKAFLRVLGLKGRR